MLVGLNITPRFSPLHPPHTTPETGRLLWGGQRPPAVAGGLGQAMGGAPAAGAAGGSHDAGGGGGGPGGGGGGPGGGSGGGGHLHLRRVEVFDSGCCIGPLSLAVDRPVLGVVHLEE